MKNIQVIDAAENCVYDIYSASDRDFSRIFPKGHDIAFIDELLAGSGRRSVEAALKRIWKKRIPKAKARGIHGILFYELEHKKRYYPTRRDEEAINPDGSRLR